MGCDERATIPTLANHTFFNWVVLQRYSYGEPAKRRMRCEVIAQVDSVSDAFLSLSLQYNLLG